MMTSEEFQSHSVQEKIAQLRNSLSVEERTSKLGIDNMAFFEEAVNYIDSRIKTLSPALVNVSDINAISAEVEACSQQLNEFFGNSNTGHIQNAINHINSAVTRFRNIPISYNSVDFNFAKSVSEFRTTVKEAYKELSQYNKKIKEAIQSYETDLSEKTTELQEIQKTITSTATDFTNTISKYTEEFEELKRTTSSELAETRDSFLAKYQFDRKFYDTAMEDSIKELKETFNTHVIGFNDNFSSLQVELQTKSDKLTSEFQEQFDKTSVILQLKLNEASKIVSIIGDVAVTGNYQRIANDHRQSANIWRIIAIIFMGIMSLCVLWSIIDLSVSTFDFSKSIVRILAAAVLTYPAIYASRESSKHRNLETHNRNLELELAAVGPFIEMLPEESKQKIKLELVNRYFGNNAVLNHKEEEDVSINAFERILKAVTPLISKKG